MMRLVKVRGGGMSRQNGKGEVNMTNLLANLLSPIYSPMGVSTADFTSYLKMCSGYIYTILAALVIMVVVLAAAGKAKKGLRGLIRWNADLPTDMYALIHGTYNIEEQVSYAPSNYDYFKGTYTNNGSYDDFEQGEHYLELSVTEENMVEKVCAEFDNVVVVINANNAMELGWVDDYPQIGAVILAPGTGNTGMAPLGQILSGAVNPSGRTADTYVKDLTKTPTWNNFGYDNVDDLRRQMVENDGAYQGVISFVNYVEGVYVGYKFYETAAQEGLISHDDYVQYPFGYGLSYTTFTQKIENFSDSGDTVSFDVKVTNTGSTAGLSNFITGAYGTAYPSEVLMAQTWNKELMYEMGVAMGQEYAEASNYGWYGPAMNTHRSAFAGRNFEYFSEDGVLAGYLAAAEINGASTKGVYPYIKHFAVNDQETNRCAVLLTYASEQAIREIYLKPFERCVKDYTGKSLAAMSSFNFIGTEPSCSNPNLLNTVLRDEWGFDGFVVSDWGGSNEHIEGVRAGSHLEMPTTGGDSDLELAKKADIVLLYIGLDEISESEGLDRPHMKLPQRQIDLLEAVAAVNPSVVAVMSAGSAVEMPWLDKCKVVIHGCLCGQAGASAVLKALVGEINPSGKLAESYPIKYEDVSSAPYFPAKQRTAEYREGLYVGYRYYETANVPVLFPFGFGLSYTTFQYIGLKVTDREAAFTLTNTGRVDGAEVAQLYVGKKDAQVFRPAKELKGFAKVFLKAGESKTIAIPLDDRAFRYFNVKTNQFEVEGGEYQIMVGASVADIRLTGTVSVPGTEAPNPYNPKDLADYYTGSIKSVSDRQFETLLGHPIPDGAWSGTLTMNDAICQMYYAKSGLARFVYRRLTGMIDKSMEKGKPNLNLMFNYNMPFRGIAKMTGGMCTMEMAEGILIIVNGHFFKGLGQIIGGFFRAGKKHKAAAAIK